MKRFASILFVLILALSVFTAMGMTAFAAEGADTGDFTESINENVNQYSGMITELLGKLKAYVPTEKIAQFKYEATTWVKAIWAFIQSEETYKNIFTAITAVLAFLFLPIIVGVVVIAYVTVAAMSVFAGVLVKVLEVFLTLLVGVIPM